MFIYLFIFIFCWNSSLVHYDPAREDHKQFEQTASEETDQEPEPAFVDEKQPEDPVLPDVSQDKYYDANTSSLAELFGNKKQVRGTMFIKSILCPGGGRSGTAGPFASRIEDETSLPRPIFGARKSRRVSGTL